MVYVILGAVIAISVIFTSTGCSTSVIVKDCKQVESEEQWVCKTKKPWE